MYLRKYMHVDQESKNDGNKTCLLVKLTQYLGRRTSYQQSDLVIVSWLWVALLLQDPDDLLWIMKPWILLSTRKSRRRISGLQFMPWSLRARQWFKIHQQVNLQKTPTWLNKNILAKNSGSTFFQNDVKDSWPVSTKA